MTVGSLSFLSKEASDCCLPITEIYKIAPSSYDKIDVSSFANVKIVEGRGDVVVRINSNLLPHLLVEVFKDELIVELDHYIDNKDKLVFDVLVSYDQKLTGISTSGFVKLKSDVVLTGSDIILTATGGSSIKAITQGHMCSVSASGVSEIELECNSETLKIQSTGASALKVDINSVRCDVLSSGASEVAFKGWVNQIRLDLSESADISLKALSYEKIYIDALGDGRLTYPAKQGSKIH